MAISPVINSASPNWKYPEMTFPFSDTLRSYFEIKDDNDKKALKTDIQMVVLTALGERVMLPTYGTSIPRRVFELIEGNAEQSIKEEVTRAITNWENDRIDLVSVDVNVDADNHTIRIIISYKAKGDDEVQTTELGIGVITQ